MQGEDNIFRPYKGLVTDTSPFDQPKESYSYALNAVNETVNGDTNFLSMEEAIEKCTSFPEGAKPIGKCYLYDDNIAVLLTSDTYDYIGIINKQNQFELYVQTTELDFHEDHPANVTFRLRRNNSKVIYWVDGLNVPRTFNFDRIQDFYSTEYNQYLVNIQFNPTLTFSGDKWQKIHFDLIKRYDKIPEFTNVEVLDGGNIVSGSYNIAIQLVDGNLNPTEWITVSNPVNIYTSSQKIEYASIRGSRNATTDAQRFPPASKSIKWTLGNLDTNFSFYRIAVLCANENDGNVNQALVSDLNSVSNNTFIYTGSIDKFTETPVSDILEQKLDIASAKYITQLENRLILAGIKGTSINWCEFQQHASKIKSKVVTDSVSINNANRKGNSKNPTTPFDKVGYMAGEVYSFGIVYVFEGGLESPAFHIPGRPENLGVSNGFDFYQCEDGTSYIDIDPCMKGDYWGYDGWGTSLLGQKIRHHKFPDKQTGITQDQTPIYGVQFQNITKPHVDIIGYRIVRNERTDDNKLVFDNAVLGPLVTENNVPSNNYHAFGLLFPEIDSTKRSTKGCYIFSPEHQFRKKEMMFDEIQVIGALNEDYKFIPTYKDAEVGTGAYVQDVSPGTSYNPEYHKTPDPDGFDLQIMYRSRNTTFNLGNQGLTIPDISQVHYLPGAGYIISDDKIFFNASTDNRIAIVEWTSDASDTLFESGGTKRLLYVKLKRNNISAYSGFMTSEYYKEHNNIFKFEGDDNNSDFIFSGDCYTNPMTIVSSVYVDTVIADRKKKSRVWKIILGAVLTIASVALLLVPGGQAAGIALLNVSATVMAAATLMAISYGITLLSSGIQFEIMKNMIDQHYEAGLKYCVHDDDNYITKNADGGVVTSSFLNPTDAGAIDDKFCWFADRLDNIYFDSSVNIGLRSGLTVGLTDFINSPSPKLEGYLKDTLNEENPLLATASAEFFESYLATKLTILDREQGDGRLYLGLPSAEFYDMNEDFLRKNKEKIYNYLPVEYDCCSISQEDFRDRVHYSEQSFQEEVLDNFRVFLPNNYRDIEGATGPITNIFRYNNSLYIHTSEALYQLPQNLQERVTSQLVTFIGTGDFFAIPPRKISDGVNTFGGCKHHQCTIITEHGVFFVSELEGKVYLFTDRINDLTQGNTSYFKNNLQSHLNSAIYDALGKDFVNDIDNTYSDEMTGMHVGYDARYSRVLLTKIDYRPLSPFKEFTGNNYIGEFVYDVTTKEFGVINASNAFVKVPLTNSLYFENKSFTMSYSFKTRTWVSWHSYLPRFYISSPNKLYSFTENDNSVYLHNFNGRFTKYYGRTYPFIVEVNSVSNPVMTRLWNHIAIIAVVKKFHSDFNQFLPDYDHFFEIMTLNNERQLSGAVHLKVKTAKENPENWFMQQITDVAHEGIVNRVEDTWFINNFRDYIVNKNEPLFSKYWSDIKGQFPIDKVINTDAIDLDKDWTEQESFRGKYLTIRLAYYGTNTDNDIRISINYVIDNEQPSIR